MSIVEFKENDKVMVYDNYRFAIPLEAEICELHEDRVRVKLITSNSVIYPIGCDTVWIHKYQLKLTK